MARIREMAGLWKQHLRGIMYDLPKSKEKEAHGHHDLHIQRKNNNTTHEGGRMLHRTNMHGE